MENSHKHIKIKEENEDNDSEENEEEIDQAIDDEQEEGHVIKDNSKTKIKNEKKEDNNDEEECESSELDIDEDRLTLVQVREFLRKKRLKKDKKNSLLHKKENPEQNITYDSNTKSLRNYFCPDVSELEDFLNNCKVQQIFDLDENNPQISKNIFDPREFMKNNNISKISLSVEDLSLYKKNGEQRKYPTEVNEEKKEHIKQMTEDEFTSTSIYKSKDKENKEKAKEQFSKIRKIMSEDVLSQEQKMWLSDFINYISKLPLQEIIDKNKKFEIVFDLDNTCMFSYIGDRAYVREAINRYPEKEMKIFTFEHMGNMIVSALIIRKGLKEFVEYVKDLCNFHISTLSVPNYGRQTAKLLENTLGIQFKKFKSRTELNECKKYMDDLKDNNYDNTFSPETAIIFDDSVSVWEKDSFNVVASKKFFDKELKNKNDKDRINDDLTKFLNSYTPFSYNRIKDDGKTSWKNQTIITKHQCPFYQYKNESTSNYNESYIGEYLTSPKYQFNYMKNVIKVIYCLVFHNDVCISEAIKLVRLNALNGKIFYLKYLNEEQRTILKDIIRVCGGDIYYPGKGYDEFVESKTKRIFLVASKRQYELMKNKIKIECDNHPNYILINERFILDSYYFMTDLGESYRDNEYSFYDGERIN